MRTAGTPFEPRPEPLLAAGVPHGGDLRERDAAAAGQVQQHGADVIDGAELARRLAHQLRVSEEIRPAATSWFAARSASMTWDTVNP